MFGYIIKLCLQSAEHILSISQGRVPMKFKAILFLGCVFFALITTIASAREEYARRTGKGCMLCHSDEIGGPLTTAGIAYIKNAYQYPIPDRLLKKAEMVNSPLQMTIRFIIGFLHLFAAVILIGAIFYIHIFIGPGQLTTGIPKGERLLGVSCLAALTLTGMYLTWFRIDKLDHFINNAFGRILLVKIILFAIMLCVAILAVTVIHRKMSQGAGTPSEPMQPSDWSMEKIAGLTGAEGKPACIVHENHIYDVTDSPKWKNGRHFGKHAAGADLTEAMKSAPHGPEVLDRVKRIGDLVPSKNIQLKPGRVHRVFVAMAYTNMGIIVLILFCISLWRWGFSTGTSPHNGELAQAAQSCIDCHRKLNPGIAADWEASVHSTVGVDCLKCHQIPAGGDQWANKAHLKHVVTPIATVVSPLTCAQCHPKEAREYAKSKHANTVAIMWKVDKWLQHGVNNETERISGCYACHGTVVELVDGKPVPGTWPNVGVGRINPDGSAGSCSSCHTRHRFSVAEARKPDACGQCHLGPDHPQIEIYAESKHGGIYQTEGDQWNWTTEDGKWLSGRDFRSPTCASCHMSAAPGVSKSHDVTERLAWEMQLPLTIRPSEFTAFPAATDWREERRKMGLVCMQCHSETWRNDHFANLDAVIQLYNDTYYRPSRQMMDSLYADSLLSSDMYFDEPIEWEFYELWHHEGRRARMGAAMMAPDYSWWHGFYELKHRWIALKKDAEAIRREGKSYRYSEIPGRLKAEE